MDVHKAVVDALGGDTAHPTISIIVKRPSGKTHELYYPRTFFNGDFEVALKAVEVDIGYWMAWCDAQQVCSMKGMKNVDNT